MDVKGLRNTNDLTAINARKAQQGEGVKERGGVQKGESKESFNVSLSDQSKKMNENFNKAHAIASNTSPVREDRVALLKEQIKNGTYKPDAGNIADGMLREAIRDHLAISE